MYSLPTRLTAARALVPAEATDGSVSLHAFGADNETGAPLIAPMYYAGRQKRRPMNRSINTFWRYADRCSHREPFGSGRSRFCGSLAAKAAGRTFLRTFVIAVGDRSRCCGTAEASPCSRGTERFCRWIRGLDNACTLPEELDVYVFAGNGAFTLIEHSGNQRLETRFAVRRDDDGTLRFTV